MDLVRLVSFGVLFMVILAGCTIVRPVIEQTDTVTVTEVIRDTTLIVEGDTAMFNAWFRCDSLNRVVMQGMEMLQGDKTKQVVKWRNNYLTVTSVVDSESVYLSWKEKNVKEVTATIQAVTEQVVVKKPPAWCKIALISGAILLLFFIFLTIKLLFDK